MTEAIADHLNLLFPLAMIFGIALAIVRGNIRARKRTAYAKGVVVRIRMRRMYTKVPLPDVAFLDQKGVRREFSPSVGASPNPWPVGSKVEVRYDPNNPANADLSTGEQFGPMLPLLIVFGMALAIWGCLALIGGSDPY